MPPQSSTSGRGRPRPSPRFLLTAFAPRLVSVVADCLRLRQLARVVLYDGPEPLLRASLGVAEGCSIESWKIFLATERCALRLQAALRDHACLEAIGAEARALLTDVRRRELERVLAARAQLVEISQIAAQLAVPTVVLKGGAAALDDTGMVTLGDVDLLVPEGDAGRFARELDARGYSPWQCTEDPSAAHLSPRLRPGMLNVEVHRRIKAFSGEIMGTCLARARPLHPASALLRLAPADDLWHLLLHVAIQHPEGRAGIRDHLLMRDAVARCTPAELASVHERMGAHASAAMLFRTLAAARGEDLRRGDATDPMAGLAAGLYASALVTMSCQPPPPRYLAVTLEQLTLALAVREPGLERPWRTIHSPANDIVAGMLPALRWRFGGRVLLIALRTLRVAGLLPVAALLARQSARATARAADTVIDTSLDPNRS